MIKVTMKEGESDASFYRRFRKAFLSEWGRKAGSMSTPAKRQAALDREARKRASKGAK